MVEFKSSDALQDIICKLRFYDGFVEFMVIRLEDDDEKKLTEYFTIRNKHIVGFKYSKTYECGYHYTKFYIVDIKKNKISIPIETFENQKTIIENFRNIVNESIEKIGSTMIESELEEI